MKFFLWLFILTFLFASISYAADNKMLFLTQEFAPFNYSVKGKVSGPVADIIREICKKNDLTCSFRSVVWKGAQDEVRKGRADAMFTVGWNIERTEWLYFSPSILTSEYGIFVSSDNKLSYKTESDLLGMKIGVYGPSNTSKSLYKIKENIKIMTVDMRSDDVAGFRKLSVGRVDGVYSNRYVGNHLIKTLKLQNIRYAGTHRKLKYYIAFSKKTVSKKVLDRFNKEYMALYKSGRIKKILAKYNMTPVNPLIP